MPKSKDAFRTISEVADWLETPAHVLRFWESKFTQVKPVKRAGGRRYYRPADMLLLGGIKKLLHDDGLTIKGAQKLLREHGVKHVSGLSQPLDDDLAEDIVEEAAFEADAQPAPEAEITPTVVSFPSRAEPPAPVAEAPTAAEAEAAASEQPAENAEEDREESTAFGKDALPAFLRRTAPERKDAAPEGLTIDPVAKLVEPEMDPEPVTEDTGAEETTALEEDAPQPAPSAPVFSHSADLPKTAQADQSPDGDDAAEDIAQRAAPKVDVPSIAKIAPELSSFEAKPGVLASLPGAKRLSPELAAEMHGKLTELRALRDRMQG